MPSIAVSATTTTEITLKPALKTRLLKELRTYAMLRSQMKDLELALDKHKAVIGGIREETGEQKLEIDGFSVTLVAPIRKKFNPKRFVAEGGDLAIYNNAMDDVTSRPYEKISCPGSKDAPED